MGNREGFLGGLARTTEPSLEQADERGVLLRARALDVLRQAVLAYFARKAREPRSRA